MEQVAKFFGFDRIDPFEQAKALAAIRDREAAEDQALSLQRGWHARMVADGLIREPGSRTRDGDAA